MMCVYALIEEGADCIDVELSLEAGQDGIAGTINMLQDGGHAFDGEFEVMFDGWWLVLVAERGEHPRG